MEKRKPWQLFVIIAVILLTIANILPTIFYYSKPLKSNIDEPQAQEISQAIVDRVNALEDESIAWLEGFCAHLEVTPKAITVQETNPSLIELTFQSSQDAQRFRTYLNQAGLQVPFSPGQLSVSAQQPADPLLQVYVQRRVGVRLPAANAEQLFTFSAKSDEEGKVAPFYRNLVQDRVSQLAVQLAGPSMRAKQLEALDQERLPATAARELVLDMAQELVDLERSMGENSSLFRRFQQSYTLSESGEGRDLIQTFLSQIESTRSKVRSQREREAKEQERLEQSQGFVASSQDQLLATLDQQIKLLEEASAIIRRNAKAFETNEAPLTEERIVALLNRESVVDADSLQELPLGDRSPFFRAITIDWNNDQLFLHPHQDLNLLRSGEKVSELEALRREKVDQLLINEVARVSRITDEAINPQATDFVVQLNRLTNSTAVLALDLGAIAQQQADVLREHILASWQPTHQDLSRQEFPVWDYETYRKLDSRETKLGLVIYSPSMEQGETSKGFRRGSLYVIARGAGRIMDKYREQQNSPEARTFLEEFDALVTLLRNQQFAGYGGNSGIHGEEFERDFIFEAPEKYLNLLNATREDFYVLGSRRYAVLEFTDVEQRIHAVNRIEDAQHEDLLKWKEEYGRAQVALDPATKLGVPPPTRNAYWNNLTLTGRKYVRGDDRKILKWGLDLSGGKTVRIGLLDQNNQPVTNEEDLKQAVNELYTRINRMGVSEQTIRIEKTHILVEFPGSQGLTAAELIKGSAMTFHIVNEKFSGPNSPQREATQRFLQNVWDRAVVTNRTDMESLNEIAWEMLGGDADADGVVRPHGADAQQLYEGGLRIPNPRTLVSGQFDDTLSAIAVARDFESQQRQGGHPLLIVFRNHALEGSNLSEVRAGYDPSQGNTLQFSVNSSYDSADKAGRDPRNDFYTWTSQFAKEQIAGTPKEAYTIDRTGWRMAIILNGSVISSPNLTGAIRDNGQIVGKFTQREINQLVADLKAGSLSFTPKILSETNISADLGKEERSRGIYAMCLGLGLVVVAMVSYYRFAGIIASIAVLFNLLIMWGVLQNLDAALTLPGLAGIILTVGMAVDANVLVFERIREEFKISGRIASAIQAGYRKAFSAIIDSNVTTIIAAVILLQFDAGPIKGFAVTLIIGVISSMFTALFMTRYFFAGWVQNPANKELNMRDWIGIPSIDFLSKTKYVVTVSAVVMLVGGYFLYDQQSTIFGMEFTGGHSLNIELADDGSGRDFRKEAMTALANNGAIGTDYQVKKLNKPNQLNIQFGQGMEEEGRPFYNLPESVELEEATSAYQGNPRLVWVVDALEAANLPLKEGQLEKLDQNWSVMSNQFSDAMRNNALMALGCALVAILVYITLRFEFKFAMSAIVALTHDVLVSMGVLAMMHAAGAPLQITMEIIGALMTIIGYSLNDTIIIFDRVREDTRRMRKASLREVVQHALNVTLSRTLMTAGTTALVLLALVGFGGQAIFAFSFIMLIGVVFGTFSSLFIACPVMLLLHQRELNQEQDHLRPSKA